jgi:putative hydrolase of the HAD superfamily
MIRAVGFDLDGTLVDHQGAVAAALRSAIERHGAELDEGEFEPLIVQWRGLERRHMDAYLAGEYSFQEQRRRRLAAFLPTLGAEPFDDAAADAWFVDYLRDYEAAWTCYDDVRPCIDALGRLAPRIPLAVLTNGDGAQQRAKLAAFGLLDRFDHVLVSTEIGAAKPAPAAFRLMVDRLGVEPGEVLFVGDWLELDAHGAGAAGLVGVWLDRASSDRSVECLRIDSLAQLPAIVADPLTAPAAGLILRPS